MCFDRRLESLEGAPRGAAVQPALLESGVWALTSIRVLKVSRSYGTHEGEAQVALSRSRNIRVHSSMKAMFQT